MFNKREARFGEVNRIRQLCAFAKKSCALQRVTACRARSKADFSELSGINGFLIRARAPNGGKAEVFRGSYGGHYRGCPEKND